MSGHIPVRSHSSAIVTEHSPEDLLSRHARLAHCQDEAPQQVPATQKSKNSDGLTDATAESVVKPPIAVQAQEPAIHRDIPLESHATVSFVPSGSTGPDARTASCAQDKQSFTQALETTDTINEGNATVQNVPFLSHFPSQALFCEPTVEHAASVQHLSDDMSIADDLDLLWSDFDVYSSLVMSQSYPLNVSALNQARFPGFDLATYDNDRQIDHSDKRDMDEVHTSGVMSRFESRLPSMQPEDQAESHSTDKGLQDAATQPPGLAEGFSTRLVPWRLSKRDYHLILTDIQSHAAVLPSDFVFPSRHALCRYVEGFFTGFHEHLPIIHLPTFSLATVAPELILAIAAVGARYRFQRKQSHHIYLAARALLEDWLRRRDAYDVPYSVFTTPGVLSDRNIQFQSSLSPFQDVNLLDHAPRSQDPKQPMSTTTERDMQTMHAMILLIALGTWNHRSLLRNAFSTASQLALLVRENHVSRPDPDPQHQTWREWVTTEGRRRTMLVAYCFLNLHSIAYNLSPKILNKEIESFVLPSPESHWRAETQKSWEAARETDVHFKTSLRAAYASLFSRSQASYPEAVSSFGNYVLIHYIIQEIFFARQLHFTSGAASSLAPDVLSHLDSALKNWQQSWESTKDSSFDPSAPGGPLSFNATALFRLAYVRLHIDFGPCRQLESRDPLNIARAFQNAPPLERSPYVARAVLQCAHSLSIPVRIGIEFVARTQTLTWSIVHSLCNLECGMFLGKWLETIASVLTQGGTLRDDEQRLLGIISSIVNETDLGLQVQQEQDQAKKITLISAAVIRLWAYTFKGAHVFEIMAPIGAGLELCADTLQQDINDNGSFPSV
ncbi:uncharacterized protein FTOL_11282 [Fusarium torulosum]|uniref:Xylanolytic transcriptional activator regulatory domain-containing protein n=1 Tax=Fusarium torulosum TaxID=33205 RepID=A0AAE8MJQ5_9HYPO|nr:uncharacterized protein FTOL_11282 [Fusarium torulosum]